MQWLEVSVRADLEAAEALSELFSRYSRGGAVVEQYPTDAQDGLSFPQNWDIVVKAYLDPADEGQKQKVEQALWHLGQIYPFGPPQFKLLEDEDWATAWRQDYTIQHIGQHIVIVPSWLQYDAQPGDVVLTIDPGMAFGTGLHPSTRLCLAALERLPLPGRSLLDVGTGSGILSIYGAKAGARPTVALEVDPVACQVAEENLRLNGIAGQVSLGLGSLTPAGYDLAQGDPSQLYPGPFDVMAINILAEVIAGLSPALAAHLADRGRIVAAGIIQERKEIVISAWSDVGLRVVERNQEGDWVSLVGAHMGSA